MTPKHQGSSGWRSMTTAIGVGLIAGLLLSIPLSRSLTQKTAGKTTPLFAISNPFNAWQGFGNRDVVVLGMDAGRGNTDVIFTIRVAGGETRIIQIPRDSYINSRNFGPMKVNALYAYGGIEAVKSELTRLMHRPISHHILVNLEGIRTIADLLGGIEVDVPKRLYYQDQSQGLYIDLQAGTQVLKGQDLEGFLRWRHDGEGDFGRLRRQQLVLKSLFRKLTRPENLVRLPALITAAGRNIKTDMGPLELGGLITAMGTTELETTRLEAKPFFSNGISYLETEWPEAAEANGSLYRFLF
ncbi:MULTISPECIES: LCP family protein [unclassified Prochlorococcus]|uniref:LCP family protein n=1 Tax=unclassified Prochlorococcus TaxID=2627481 RepID=UPI000533B052|nr:MULTISPECIES: LCP family protein [unclassified Prochlorococcus]KGG25486.1 Cell envelope-associated transcriptional attenuator LytR-CpsA-Psr [Prochlorococcus sp. MIT 0701]KGG28045.1 Cell envelope-associated transcriptional attenuator LytR-CpsA-Psr [Prochlorococcus sp. MIT 0702]KGG33652.1 Cell envelope-associated transcriptional attenuator LytR-CpsA-Psr [Prochlorococcus sp. MIT 0703]